MDEMQGEGIEPDAITNLDVSDVSGHWERALKFINIVQRYFEHGATPDVETRQRASVLALTEGWKTSPPEHPIILAGSTGSRGTTFRLMQAIAHLPQGALILPGFDFDMPNRVWERLADPKTSEDHPQYKFSRLLTSLGIAPNQVEAWTSAPPEALPITNSSLWRCAPPQSRTTGGKKAHRLKGLDAATGDITWLEAPNQRVEAMAIALRLRQAADDGPNSRGDHPGSKPNAPHCDSSWLHGTSPPMTAPASR